MIKKLILAISLLLVAIGNSQTIKKGWNCFDGAIGKSDVVVNVYRDSIGNLTGDYCYKKYETRIPLKGKVNGDVIFLDEFIDNKINAKFNGKINEETNTITGKWSSTTHSDIAFSLRLNSQSGQNPDSKYSFFSSDETVELFLKKTKKSILADDKIWLSKNTKYPLTLYGRKHNLKIKNAKSFLKNYKLIITESLKQSIQESCICDIFSNWRGAMIANGSIWINEYDNSGIKISAINN